MRGIHRFFRVIGYRTSLSSARNAITYAAFRSEAVKGQSPLIFDDRTDSADVRSFQQQLADPVTGHPKSAKAFHTLFSLLRAAYEQAGIDWRDVVREVMHDYELQTRRRLTWIAVQHDDPKHPHAHVVIKATYRDPIGRVRKLYLRKPELERFKTAVGKAMEVRGVAQEPPTLHRRMERTPVDRLVSALGPGYAWLQEQLEAERRRRKREQAEADRQWHDRWDDDRGR